MKITDYQIQKNEKRVSVFVDGKYSFSVTKENYVLNGLAVGKEITESEIELISIQDEKSRALSYVAYQLGFGLKTEKEIRDKLKKQKYSDESQEYAISKAKEYSFINDAEYCECFINQHKNSDGWGQRKIISALYKKGLAKELIDEKIHTCYSKDEIFQNAHKCALKKYNTLASKDLEEYKLKQKIYMFLVGRGFDYEVIQSVIEDIFSNN